MKYTLFVFILFLMSCSTTEVIVLDGVFIEQKSVVKFSTKVDTIRYITLWNGDVITVEEFNRRWDKSVSETTNKIKKNL